MCANVTCQARQRHHRPVPPSPPALVTGERVRFVGLLAQPWETTGTVTETRGDFVLVVWDSDPYATARPLHSSQVERTPSPPCRQHAYDVALLVSQVPKGKPCVHCGEPYR